MRRFEEPHNARVFHPAAAAVTSTLGNAGERAIPLIR
jgi:hypothetical protein